MKSPPWALAALLACALSMPAAAQVDASMTYHGATVKLDHVLAVPYGDEEGLESGPQLWIFLSDREIPLNVAERATILPAKQYVLDGKFSGVVIVADPQGRKTGGEVHVLNAPGLAEGSFATASSSDLFHRLKVADGHASGDAVFEDDDIKLRATFDAPVVANPVSLNLTGAAALGSAPVKALLAYTRAMHAGDAAGMARFATAAQIQGLKGVRAQMGEKTYAEMVKSQPDADVVAKTLTRVVVRGANASVIYDHGTIASLVLESDGWKCDE
jgi:hypothetical protein